MCVPGILKVLAPYIKPLSNTNYVLHCKVAFLCCSFVTTDLISLQDEESARTLTWCAGCQRVLKGGYNVKNTHVHIYTYTHIQDSCNRVAAKYCVLAGTVSSVRYVA